MSSPDGDDQESELPAPGAMVQIEVDGEAVLVVHDPHAIYAVAARCPHAGAPLIEGIRHGDRIVCPWHKAAFCLRTGRVLDPPALDPLSRYDVGVNGQRIRVTKAGVPIRTEPAPDPRTFVIVGAGAAGAVAAQTLRENGFAGRVVMLDDVNRVPYDRTLLSKYALSGEAGAEKSPLQSQAFYRTHGIERRRAVVTGIDPHTRSVTCADGTALHYDAALLATGSVAVPASLPGSALRNVFTLRSKADLDAILAQAEQSERAVILGASFIGMEVAASLRERGLGVTVVGKEAAPFQAQLGAEVGSAFVGLHEGHGVAFRLRAGVVRLLGDADVSGVLLESGERLDADIVIVGFGAKPATSMYEGFARDAKGAVIVDSQLRITDGLFAAGDIASVPDRVGGQPIRVEHWRLAQQQGRVAALNMLGQPTPFEAVPYFWTIQYMKRLDYVGHATEWDGVVIHGDLGTPAFLAYYVKDGHVAAAAGLDRDKDMAALIELFGLRRDWSPADLGADPAARLARQ